MKDWYREAAHLKVHSALNNVQIAEKLGKGYTTVVRAFKLPEVSAFIDQLRAEKEQKIAETSTELLTDMIDLSWATLRNVLEDDDAPHSAKVTAALGVLKGTGELVERTQEQQNHLHLHGVVQVPQEIPFDRWDEYVAHMLEEPSGN